MDVTELGDEELRQEYRLCEQEFRRRRHEKEALARIGRAVRDRARLRRLEERLAGEARAVAPGLTDCQFRDLLGIFGEYFRELEG